MRALTPQLDTKVSSPTDFSFLLTAQKPSATVAMGAASGDGAGFQEEISKTKTKRRKKRNSSAQSAQCKRMKRIRGRPHKKFYRVLNDASSRFNQADLKDDGLSIASVSTLAPYEMPEATEEVWQHRQEA